jgi:hypothetical protein
MGCRFYGLFNSTIKAASSLARIAIQNPVSTSVGTLMSMMNTVSSSGCGENITRLNSTNENNSIATSVLNAIDICDPKFQGILGTCAFVIGLMSMVCCCLIMPTRRADQPEPNSNQQPYRVMP